MLPHLQARANAHTLIAQQSVFIHSQAPVGSVKDSFFQRDQTEKNKYDSDNWDVSQMAPLSLCSALLLTMVKSSALCREEGAIWHAVLVFQREIIED